MEVYTHEDGIAREQNQVKWIENPKQRERETIA